MEKFWQELKRRKVVHVITVNVAIVFGIYQLVDIIERHLRLPEAPRNKIKAKIAGKDLS